MNEQDILMTEKQVSELLDISPRTLQIWRCRRIGPPFLKVNKRIVRYWRSDVLGWLGNQGQAA
jgi:DNA-binding transcriptional MerR regulator